MARAKSCSGLRFVDSDPFAVKSRDEIGEQRRERGGTRVRSRRPEADNAARWHAPC